METVKEWTQLFKSENTTKIAQTISAIESMPIEQGRLQLRNMMHGLDQYAPFAENTTIAKNVVTGLVKVAAQNPQLKSDVFCDVAAICSQKFATRASDAHKAGTFEGMALAFLKMAADLFDDHLYGDAVYKTYAQLLDSQKRWILKEAKGRSGQKSEANTYLNGVMNGITVTAAAYANKTLDLVEFRDELGSELKKKGYDLASNSKLAGVLKKSGSKSDSRLSPLLFIDHQNN